MLDRFRRHPMTWTDRVAQTVADNEARDPDFYKPLISPVADAIAKIKDDFNRKWYGSNTVFAPRRQFGSNLPVAFAYSGYTATAYTLTRIADR